MAYRPEPGASGNGKNPARSIRMLPLMLAMVFTILLTLSGVVGVLVYLAKVNKLPSGLASSVTSGSPDGSPWWMLMDTAICAPV